MDIPKRPHFVLHWTKIGALNRQLTSVKKLVLLHISNGVYLIFSGRKKIQYIGITGTNFAKRVGQHLRGIQRLGVALPEDSFLYVAQIEPKAYKQVSWKMLDEIETFLVWAIGPEGNTAKRKAYKGREMLIQNVGDDFGLPRYLYVRRIEPVTFVGQGNALDQIRVKSVGRFKWSV